MQHTDHLNLVATVAEINHMRSDWAFEIVGAHIDVSASLAARCQPLERRNQIAVVAVSLRK